MIRTNFSLTVQHQAQFTGTTQIVLRIGKYVSGRTFSLVDATFSGHYEDDTGAFNRLPCNHKIWIGWQNFSGQDVFSNDVIAADTANGGIIGVVGSPVLSNIYASTTANCPVQIGKWNMSNIDRLPILIQPALPSAGFVLPALYHFETGINLYFEIED